MQVWLIELRRIELRRKRTGSAGDLELCELFLVKNHFNMNEVERKGPNEKMEKCTVEEVEEEEEEEER